MIIGSICMSHSPLMDRNRAEPETERRFHAAVQETARIFNAMRPDLIIAFYPDHMNGFQYNILPPFCIGARARSLGDYGSVPGELLVDEDAALSLAASVLEQGVDVALSFNMLVDHGATQPLELLASESTVRLPPILPVFINCAAGPRPPFRRARALGEAVGEWSRARPERILFMGSGGLSHDPPLPNIATASPDAKERMIAGGATSFADRMVRQRNVFRAGAAFKDGETALRDLNPEWDRHFMAAMANGDTAVADDWTDSEVSEAGGGGANEVRCWLAAMAALSRDGAYRVASEFYEPVPEWITGMGLMSAWSQAASTERETSAG
ncbi:3-carboxyethylcatechol 2,3-dioxygenase [Sphingobium sp. EM0848]|uniref:3-carboxyethylcatechol 2,3-dioxygenase n=1 Tax=Sphingobium sp. EM0848 TaxID=2743473 RepID=UPI00159C3394|nr:3-carboxyethylcatechol 2,3-dioxygenase [Sphingobium sp. EM0848]